MKENGQEMLSIGMECWRGQLAAVTKVLSRMTKLMGVVAYSMHVAQSTMDSGLMAKRNRQLIAERILVRCHQ